MLRVLPNRQTGNRPARADAGPTFAHRRAKQRLTRRSYVVVARATDRHAASLPYSLRTARGGDRLASTPRSGRQLSADNFCAVNGSTWPDSDCRKSIPWARSVTWHNHHYVFKSLNYLAKIVRRVSGLLCAFEKLHPWLLTSKTACNARFAATCSVDKLS